MAVAPGLLVRPRSSWAGDSRPPTGPLSPETPLFLLVHHTASANGADPVATMRSAYDFHTGPDRGWPDVAYNFFIDQFGVVWEGRFGSLDGPVEASATGGSQGFAQLVCLLGDFTAVLPTAAAVASLELTLAWLADRHDIDTRPGATVTFTSRGSNRWPAGTEVSAATISGHRDMSQTACPGDTFYPYLVSNVPAAVDALRSTGAPTTVEVTPPTEASRTTDAPAQTDPATPDTSPPVETPGPTDTPDAGTVRVSGPATTAAAEGDGSDSVVVPALGLGAATLAGAALWYTARRRAGEAPRPPDDE